MVSTSDILAFIQQHKVEFAREYHLSKIGIFGSYARGEQTDSSDIDLIVEFQEGTEDLFSLKLKLASLFESRFQKDVDICREKYVKPYFRKRILNDAIFV